MADDAASTATGAAASTPTPAQGLALINQGIKIMAQNRAPVLSDLQTKLAAADVAGMVADLKALIPLLTGAKDIQTYTTAASVLNALAAQIAATVAADAKTLAAS